MKEVIYKDIKDFPGYRIASDGHVWSRRKQGCIPGLGNVWRKLNSFITGGYYKIELSLPGVRKIESIHVLLLTYFISEKPAEGWHGCHNNGNPLDNRLENLRWDSPEGNNADKLKHGTDNRGEKQGSSKLKNWQVIEIKKKLADGIRGCDLANEYMVSKQTICNIKYNRRWDWL